jgi:squalene synthase HpnC
MASVSDLGSGKGHRDENFPVASFLIAPDKRAIVLAFYRFARAADDVADHATAPPEEKLRLLDEMRRTILGEADSAAEALALRSLLAERNLTAQHCVDLLEAFWRDVTKRRYRDWDELMDYCRYSANPVGRFVLDVHGEVRATWPAADALCSALQVINHLQDCGKDFRDLDRVYIPLDAFAAQNIGPEALAAPRASPALRNVIVGLAKQTSTLLERAKPFSSQIRDRRLALEVAVIQRLAEDLVRKLMRRDPLSDRVHHRKMEALWLAAKTALGFCFARPRSATKEHEIAGERR